MTQKRGGSVLLRLTRHNILPAQQKYLEKRYGVLTIVQYPNSLSKSKLLELKERFKPDLVEMVGPMHLIEDAKRIFGVPVIKAIMNRSVAEGGSMNSSFSHYVQFKEIRVETVPL